MILVVRDHFDAAHFLPGYKGKCADMHGHRWVVEIEIEGLVKNDGMIMDFSDVKQIIKEVFDDGYDHKCLNHRIENPTAECIAKTLYQTLASKLNIKSIRLWESPNCSVIYQRSDAP